jgi:hypothetical protein
MNNEDGENDNEKEVQPEFMNTELTLDEVIERP